MILRQQGIETIRDHETTVRYHADGGACRIQRNVQSAMYDVNQIIGSGAFRRTPHEIRDTTWSPWSSSAKAR
jgi:hypothetical protein